MVPSIGAWAELAAQLKRRRKELAAKQDSAAIPAPAVPQLPSATGVRPELLVPSTASTPDLDAAAPMVPLALLEPCDGPLRAVLLWCAELNKAVSEPEEHIPEVNGSGAVDSAGKRGGAGMGVVAEEQPSSTQNDSAANAASDTPMKHISSGVGTPGASKPRPGVRSSAIGPFLARMRREAAEG